MPWTGSAPNETFTRTDGTRTGSTVWQQADAASVDIVPDDHDTHDEDIGDGLNLALKKDGGNTATADIPMGGNKFTNLGDAEAVTEALTFDQAQDNKHNYIPTVGGSANSITLTSPAGLAVGAYAAGQVFIFKVGTTNTGATQANIDTLGLKDVKRFDGSTDLVAGDLTAGHMAIIIYDGTLFQLYGDTQTSASTDLLGRVMPAGAIIWWPLDTIPAGWLKCNGQTVTKTSYPELDLFFYDSGSANSYPYGASSQTFAVGTMDMPDIRGRFIRNVDDSAGNDPDAASRTNRGDTGTGDVVGTNQADAVDDHTHSDTLAMSNHTHGIASGQNFSRTPASTVQSGTGASGFGTQSTTTDGPSTTALTGSVGSINAGADTSTETRPINIYMYAIILADPSASSTSANGASVQVQNNSELLSAMSGASVSTTSLVPAGATLLGVTTRVTTLITSGDGGTDFNVGHGLNSNRWGGSIAFAADTTTDHSDFTADPRIWSSSAQDVTLTCAASGVEGGETFSAGAVRVTAFYRTFVAPSS